LNSYLQANGIEMNNCIERGNMASELIRCRTDEPSRDDN